MGAFPTRVAIVYGAWIVVVARLRGMDAPAHIVATVNRTWIAIIAILRDVIANAGDAGGNRTCAVVSTAGHGCARTR